MKIIITNRLNNLPNETLENIDINLSGFILALWETPESERSKFSSFIHKGKALDADKITQMLVLNQYNQPKSIDPKKIYSGRLHSVTLTANINWEALQIDETSYLKHRSKNSSFLPNLIKQHAKTKSTLSASPIPEFMMESPLLSKKRSLLRPNEEVNPAYPIPSVPPFDPTVEASRPRADSLPDIVEPPISQKTKNNLKKIILLSLLLGVGVGCALALFNMSVIASIIYASLASTTAFIIAKTTPNTSGKPSIPAPVLPGEKEETKEKNEPVKSLLKPGAPTEKASIKEDKNNKDNKDNKIKKMPPKPTLSIRALTKKPSTVFESSEDSEDSEDLEESDDMNPKRAANRR